MSDPVRITLSRRNLTALLSKLDRQAAGEITACTLIKNDNNHPIAEYNQSPAQIIVTAVEDDQYYIDRAPGGIHPADIK